MSEPTNPDELNENDLDQVVGGTSSGALDMSSDASTKPPTAPQSSLQPGLYVQVLDGAIHVGNSSAANSLAPGQFGYVANAATPPVVLPTDPGLQFTPPPIFNATKP